MNRSCPFCKQEIQIPQPIPDQFDCQVCGATIKAKKKDAPTGSKPQPAAKKSPPKPAQKSAPAKAPQKAATPTPQAQSKPAQQPTVQPAAGQPAASNVAASAQNPGGQSAANGQWYYALPNSQRGGPCTLEELRTLISDGKIPGQNMVYGGGVAQWRPANTVAELANVSPTPPVSGSNMELPSQNQPTDAALQSVQPTPAAAPSSAFSPQELGSTEQQPLLTSQANVPVEKTGSSGGALSKLHSSLPKPVLFGIYGALGGLLGVLLLGELSWQFLRPTPPAQEIAIATPKSITVYRGSDNKLLVRVARQNFKGKVRLKIENVPKDIQATINQEVLDANESATTISFTELKGKLKKQKSKSKDDLNKGKNKKNKGKAKVKDDKIDEGPDPLLAPTETHEVTIHVEAVDQPKIEAAREKVKLTIDPLPAVLNLNVPEEVRVYVGGINQLPFAMTRERFHGPVRLEILDAPEGLEIPLVYLPEYGPANPTKSESWKDPTKKIPLVYLPANAKTKKNATAGQFQIHARDVEEGDYLLDVEARSLRDHKIASRKKVLVRVQPEPGRLRMNVSKRVEVYPGTRNKFSLKIGREDFDSDVVIDVEVPDDLPKEIELKSTTVPKSIKDGEIEVSALQMGDVKKAQEYKIKITARSYAKGPTGENQKLMVHEDAILVIAPPPPTLQVAASPVVKIFPGGKATFGVKVVRQRFQDPVTVQVPNQAVQGIRISSSKTTIAGDSETGQIVLTVPATALSMKLPATINAYAQASAHAKETKKNLSARATFKVEVLSPDPTLEVAVSPKVEVYQRGKCSFSAKIARGNFLGNVKLKFDGLPAGVSITGGNFSNRTSSTTLKGEADKDVKTGNYKVEVTATGKAAHNNKKVTNKTEFMLVVKEFDPATKPPLDIVFVLDVTESMNEQIQGIKNGVQQFVNTLKQKDLETRVGLVAFTDIQRGPDYIKIMEFNKQKLTSDLDAFRTVVGGIKPSKGFDEPESSFDALLEAVDLPFRKDALRIFMLVTDAPAQQKPNSVDRIKALNTLRSKKIDQLFMIVPQDLQKPVYVPKVKSNYHGMKDIMNASFYDLQKVAKTQKGFVNLLSNQLSEKILEAIPGKEPVKPGTPKELQTAAAPPNLSTDVTIPEPPKGKSAKSPDPVPVAQPIPGRINVEPPPAPSAPTVANVAPPQAETPSLQGVQSGQVYAEEDRFRLLIAIALWTATLSGGIALTLVAAQKRYLHNRWLTWMELLKTLGAGMLAGLLAGAAGQWFFQSMAGDSWWTFLPRVLAWTILGGLIGAGVGLFVPNLQWKRAFWGGCIGGLIGASGFVLINLLGNDLLGRWIGGGLLGLCIGLMVALAELAFRRYWLEIAFGEREIRTVNLGNSTVTIGGDESQAGVHVPGAPPRAYGYRVEKNKVICEDFTTGKTTEVSPGDSIEVGKAKIRVCSPASAKPTGVTLQLAIARNVSLMDGMPLTADDIPGLEAKGMDGVVAMVSKRPTTPQVYLLRNRSKQAWSVTDAEGKKREIGPGLSIELTSKCEVDFGQAKAVIDPSQLEAVNS